MVFDLPPITSRGQKLSDFVYDALCQHIIKGKLPAGQRLRESETADALGVSRTPVREAFALLERQFLLDKDTNGAYFVARWDKEILWEVATLRGALEGLAIRHACKNLEPKNFDHLEGLAVQMDAAVDREDYEQLISLDIAFHSYLWAQANHKLLQQTLDDMKAQVLYFMWITRPGDEIDYPNDHRIVIDVLRTGDPDLAEQVIRRHIVETAERAITRLPLSS